MKIREVNSGDKVSLKTKKGDFECIILESPKAGIVLVKLRDNFVGKLDSRANVFLCCPLWLVDPQVIAKL